MTVYELLHFSRCDISLNPQKTAVTLTVWFHKSIEEAPYEEDGSHYTEKISRTWNVPKQLQIFNYNQRSQVLSTLSGDGLDIYVAVYWERATMDQPMLCMSVEPIPSDWWVTSEA